MRTTTFHLPTFACFFPWHWPAPVQPPWESLFWSHSSPNRIKTWVSMSLEILISYFDVWSSGTFLPQVVARVPFLSCSLTSRRRCRAVPVTRCRCAASKPRWWWGWRWWPWWRWWWWWWFWAPKKLSMFRSLPVRCLGSSVVRKSNKCASRLVWVDDWLRSWLVGWLTN